MNQISVLEHGRVILARPSHPGNIGAAARAMKNMGLSRLWLVEPERFPDPEADARASGADDVLVGAQVVSSLSEALADTVFSVALTARRRDLSLARAVPRQAVGEVLAWAEKGEVALVFGNEAVGLTNDELSRCSLPVTIPTNPDFTSLNLGAAVQVMCYELRMAVLGEAAAISDDSLGEPAAHVEVEGFFDHLEKSIIASGFLDPEKPRRLMPRMRRLFGRTRLEKEEVAILRGILSSFDDLR